MGRFGTRLPQNQVKSLMKVLAPQLNSIRTQGNYRERLMVAARILKETGQGELRDLTPQAAINYLEKRGEEVGQKTLDMDRQAIQAMMRKVTGKLDENTNLTVVKSERKQILQSRSYTKDQVEIVANAQGARNQLSTQLVHACGLRGHELLTIARAEEKPMSDRPALDAKFSGREGVTYTVSGKGGLVREILVPHELATKLEVNRLDPPQLVLDRGVKYSQRYDIAGGQKWATSFSSASKRSLNWTGGGHGLRHSYAQERMSELHNQGSTYRDSLEIVSQEMGHFRPEITEVYLR